MVNITTVIPRIHKFFIAKTNGFDSRWGTPNSTQILYRSIVSKKLELLSNKWVTSSFMNPAFFTKI